MGCTKGWSLGGCGLLAALVVVACSDDPPPAEPGPPTLPPSSAPDAGSCPSGLTSCSGTCVDLTRDAAHCGDCTTTCDDASACVSGQCKPMTSCKDLHAKNPAAPSGAYTFANLPLYCDMTTADGGWTMVYRVSRGVAGDPFALFTGDALNDESMTEATPLGTDQHYVSRIIKKWNTDFAIESVRAHVYNDADLLVRTLMFDGKGSMSTDWFAAARLKVSSWNDPETAEKFSLEGDGANMRRFLIHGPYAGCDTDAGWLVVHGTNNTPACPWETPAAAVRIYYSNDISSQVWQSGQAAEGKSFAVFVR